jgi:hypothetical protein
MIGNLARQVRRGARFRPRFFHDTPRSDLADLRRAKKPVTPVSSSVARAQKGSGSAGVLAHPDTAVATCSIEWTSAEARVAAVCVLRAISQGGRALLLDRSRDRAGTGREFIDGARDGGYLVD